MRVFCVLLCLLFGQVTAFSEIKKDGACYALNYKGAEYTVCKAIQGQYNLKLFWKSQKGTPFASLRSLDSERSLAKKPLWFSMNAGMFDRSEERRVGKEC